MADVPVPREQGRLQRPPDFTGARLTTFRAVFLRHGLPGLLLGAVCLAHPALRNALADALTGFAAAPLRYLAVGLGILAGLLAYTAVLNRRMDRPQVTWILYLLLVSIWEEWLFRLAIPDLSTSAGLDPRLAIIASNALFGVMHYFTLRWKWYWCVAAFLGGMALSRNLAQHQDLALIIALHWIATFLNTPRPPGRATRR